MAKCSFIICGPPRAGKTTLVHGVADYSRSILGFSFEGLFPAYMSRLSYKIKGMHRKLYRDYLRAPRYSDKAKGESVRPIDSCGARTCDDGASLLENLGIAFEEAAVQVGKKGWAIADLHAELYWRKILKEIPQAHFVLVLRHPLECVCAGLYWRFYPESIPHRSRWFYKRLFSWVLSAQMALNMQKNVPDVLTVLNYNDLQNGDTAVLGATQRLFDLEDSWGQEALKKVHYSLCGDDLFLTPDCDGEALLTDRERQIVYAVCAPYMKVMNYGFSQSTYKLPAAFVFSLNVLRYSIVFFSKVAPPLALFLINLVFFPLQTVKNQFERLKQFVKDVIR